MPYTSCLKNCVNTHTDQLSVTVFLCGPSSGLAVNETLLKPRQARPTKDCPGNCNYLWFLQYWFRWGTQSHPGFEALNPGSQKQGYAWFQFIIGFQAELTNHSSFTHFCVLLFHKHLSTPYMLCLQHWARNGIGMQKALLCLREVLRAKSNWTLNRQL